MCSTEKQNDTSSKLPTSYLQKVLEGLKKTFQRLIHKGNVYHTITKY